MTQNVSFPPMLEEPALLSWVIEHRIRDRESGLSKFSGAPIYWDFWEHRAVVFAIAQLSCQCMVSFSIANRILFQLLILSLCYTSIVGYVYLSQYL